MYIVPEAGSTRRNNATPREDLPRIHTRTDIRIPYLVISTPSMYIVPEAGSTRRNNATPREDLPRIHTRTDIRIPYLVISTPSMYIVPEAGSTRRNNATPREDLPRTGDKNISILHLSCRTSDLQLSLVLQTHTLVL